MIALALLSMCISQNSDLQNWWEYRSHYERAIEARRDQRGEDFFSEIKSAHALNPHHLMSRIFLAIAHLQRDEPQRALALLRKVAEMGLFIDCDRPIFAGLEKTGGFADLKKRFAENNRPRGMHEVVLTIPQPDLFPEALALDSMRGDIYVSSVRHRKIIMRGADGSLSDFVTTGQDGLWSVLGLALDESRRWLWACSSAMRETKDIGETEIGRTGLFAFDLDSGELRRKFLLDANEKHNLGDLAVHPDGSVFASDGAGGAIYRVDPQLNRIERWLEHPQLRSPQGLCFDRAGKLLYVADYSHGILVVDLSNKTMSPIDPGDRHCLLGIDGLLRYGNSLISIQNGVKPHRVVRWFLRKDGRRIARAEVLAANLPGFDEPTLGIINGTRFDFIGNTQWSKYDGDRNPLGPEFLKPIRVLGLSLEP